MERADIDDNDRSDWRRLLTAIFLIRTNPSSNIPLVIWLCAAVASLAVATVVAFRPGQLADLWMVRDWLRHWRDDGNPYSQFFGQIDYPPAAFLLLWPLHWPSDETVVLWFIPITIIAMAAAGLILVRWLSERMRIALVWQEQAALAAMMLADSATRGGIWRGQTAALAVLLGALSLYWCRRRPFAAAIALALCAYKPHVAIGFALAIFLTERRDVVFIAGAIVVSMWWIVAASIGLSLAEVVSQYSASLLHIYDGPDRLHGLLSIRWVIEQQLERYDTSTMIYAVIATSSLVLIALAAYRHRDAPTRATVSAACLLWSLVFLPHQLYHGVMALPAVWLLMWPEAGVVKRHSIRVAVVAFFVLFSVLDIPRIVRMVISRYDDIEGAVAHASYTLNPIVMAALFTLMLSALARRTNQFGRAI